MGGGVRSVVEWVAVGLLAGQLAVADGVGATLGASGSAGAAAVLVLAGIVAARRSRAVAGAAMAAVPAALLGGVLVARVTAMPDDPRDVARLALPMRTRVVGRVAGRPVVDERRTVFVVEIERAGGDPGPVATSGRVRVRARGRAAVAQGDVVAFEATLRRPRNFENPGRFDLVGLLARQRIHVVASVWDATTIARLAAAPARGWQAAIERWRRAVRTAMAEGCEPVTASVLVALVLGDETGIPAPLRDAFTRAGVVHVLSVSGLHVGIVLAATAGLAAWVLGRSEAVLLHLDRRAVATLVGLAAAGVYGVLAGLALATLRSLAMAAVVAVAVALDRRATIVRALALAAVALLVAAPGCAGDVSFQLSFASVAALAVGAGRTRATRARGWAAGVLAAGVAAWVGTAPLTAFHFHQVSLASVVANPIVVPLFEGVALMPALAGALLAPVAPAVAAVAFAIAAAPIRLAVAIVRTIGASPWAAADVPLPDALELALLYGAVAGVCWRGVPWGRLLLAASLTALALDAAWWARERAARPDVRVTFLDVGQGDAAVVELPLGPVVVVDAGGFPGSDFDTGAAIVEPFLRARKIARIDALVMSHAHPDHAAGLARLVRAFRPRELWWSGHGGAGATWEALARTLAETATPVRVLRVGAAIPDFPEIDVLHPPRDWTSASLNDGSLVLRVRVGGRAVLLAGDAEAAAEAAMSSTDGGARLSADVVKMPHHGSRTSSTRPFVAAAGPTIAVASVGAGNRFGHPAPEVLARYAAAGASVYRTDACGAVTVWLGPGRLDAATARPGCAPVGAVTTRPR